MQDGTEIVGRYVLAFVESTGQVSPVFERKTRDIFAENALEIGSIEEDGWYDAHSYADAMHQVLDEVGEKTLREAGAEQAANVPWPDHVNSVMDALQFLVQADRDAHRAPVGEFAGSYDVESVGGSIARVGISEDTPYPVENFEGVFKGAVRAVSSEGHARLEAVDSRVGETAAFEVTW